MWVSRLLDPVTEAMRGAVFRRSATAMTAMFARACQQVAALALVILAAGVMVPAEYGVYTLAIIFVLLLQTLTYSGLFQYVVTAKGDESAVLDTAFWLMMAIAVVGAILLVVISPLVSMMFHSPEVGEVLRWLALAQPFAAAVAWASAVFMREERLQTFYTIMIVQNLVAMVVGVALLFMWKSVFALVAYRYIRAILGTVLYFGYSKTWPGLKARRDEAVTAIRYASGLYGSRAVTFLSVYAGDILLGIFLSTAEAGIYRFGVRVATATLNIVIQPMKAFALARFGAQERRGEALGPSMEMFWSTAFVLLGCGAGAIMVFSEPMIRSFFRPEYMPAAVVASAFAAKAFFGAGEMFVEPFLAAKGRTGIAMAFGSISTGATILAVLVTAPFGLQVLSWAQAVVTLLATIGGLALIGRMEEIDFGGGALRFTEAAGLVAIYGGVLLLIYRVLASLIDNQLGALILSAVIGGVLGLGVLAVSYRRKLFYLKVFSD